MAEPQVDMKASHFNDGREAALHQDIVSKQAELQGKPWAVVDAVNTRGRMMIFKKSKLDVSRKVLEQVKPPPKVVVELGTYVGNSAVAWGQILKELNDEKDWPSLKVYSMELNSNFVAIARDLVKIAGLTDIVEIVEGQSGDNIKKLTQEGRLKQVDLLFLDHWEKFYLPDLQLVEDLKLLHNNSILIADNTDMPGAPDYVEYVRKGGRAEKGGYKLQSEAIPTTDEKGKPNVLEVTKVSVVE